MSALTGKFTESRLTPKGLASTLASSTAAESSSIAASAAAQNRESLPTASITAELSSPSRS